MRGNQYKGEGDWKLFVTIPEPMAQRLAQRVATQGVSVAEVVRSALGGILFGAGRPRRSEGFAPSLSDAQSSQDAGANP